MLVKLNLIPFNKSFSDSYYRTFNYTADRNINVSKIDQNRTWNKHGTSILYSNSVSHKISETKYQSTRIISVKYNVKKGLNILICSCYMPTASSDGTVKKLGKSDRKE